MVLQIPIKTMDTNQMEDIFENDANENLNFSEYLWMENEEEFDKAEIQRLIDEDCMRECLIAMLYDEMEEEIKHMESVKKKQLKAELALLPPSECDVSKSILNPLADEFIPRRHFFVWDKFSG
ncbi:polyadenylate-binding protein-interacting protein 2-like [Haematobia irritans]|uniref:polyadenylate-binding protein-interacting protein 2-like n=1 Tax=Haematobia irritans TaxID=7368 RepID=UPI003F500C4F